MREDWLCRLHCEHCVFYVELVRPDCWDLAIGRVLHHQVVSAANHPTYEWTTEWRRDEDGQPVGWMGDSA